MSNIPFHNKFHRSTHHTVSAPGFLDSNLDPIASESQPFSGVFYNSFIAVTGSNEFFLTTFGGDSILSFLGVPFITIIVNYESGILLTNSYEWTRSYNHMNQLSGEWEKYPTTLYTVSGLSANWDKGTLFAQRFQNSGIRSTQTTFRTYSSNWLELKDTLRTNVVQENTRAKNFQGVNLQFNANSAYWDLSAQQMAFATFPTTCSTYYVKNIFPPSQKKKGGKYSLVFQQTSGAKNIEFDSDYVFQFPLSSNTVIDKDEQKITVIKFTCDGSKLYGKATYYSLSGLNDITYFAGDGIILSPSPADLFFGDVLIPAVGSGLIVFGSTPYSTSDTIIII